MLKIGFLFKMMTSNTSQTNLARNVCLDIRVNLKTDHIEGEDDAEVALKELLDIVDRHERRHQPNIDSPLKVNLGIEAKPKIVFVGAKLDRKLKTN